MSQPSVIIEYTKKAFKERNALTANEKAILDALEQDLRETAGKPFARGWKSLGELRGQGLMHCHLTYRTVAIWDVEEHGTEIKIVLCRFEYIGKRGKAPY